MTVEAAYQKLIGKEKRRSVIASLDAVLSWDEATFMPMKGVALRGEQKAFVATEAHKALIDPEFGELLDKVEASPLVKDESVQANVREIRRIYDRAVKLPPRLVEAFARAITVGREKWIEARRESNFEMFRPHLEEVVALRKEEAALMGFENPYDAMLDLYEPGSDCKQVSQLLTSLEKQLVPLVDKILAKASKEAMKFPGESFPTDIQHQFGHRVITAMGFDLTRGRLDTTTHPFCNGFSPDDVRITTRYQNEAFTSALFSTVHEAGHGLYEQGLLAQNFGTPLGRACSMAIHESQSRLWENFVARSKSFWEHFYPMAQGMFSTLKSVSLDDFLQGIWSVKRSTIRVDADEVTYNLHVLLRFDLEQRIFSGQLNVADLPEAWNDKFEKLFRFRPPSDAHGCLQDVHWSGGDFGYFPTYTLGNCYAAQFADKAEADLGSLDDQFRKGSFSPLREWLRKKIHVEGQKYSAGILCEKVTGQKLSIDPLIRHLERRYLM